MVVRKMAGNTRTSRARATQARKGTRPVHRARGQTPRHDFDRTGHDPQEQGEDPERRERPSPRGPACPPPPTSAGAARSKSASKVSATSAPKALHTNRAVVVSTSAPPPSLDKRAHEYVDQQETAVDEHAIGHHGQTRWPRLLHRRPTPIRCRRERWLSEWCPARHQSCPPNVR